MKRIITLIFFVACGSIASASNFYTDTFTGTNGTSLSAHVPDLGTGYTVVAGSGVEAKLNGSNKLDISTDVGFYDYLVTGVTPPTADYTVEADFTALSSPTSGLFLITRGFTTTGNLNGYIFGYWSGYGQYRLYRYDNSSPTQLTTAAGSITAGAHVWKMTISGTTITCNVDGTDVITFTDSTYASAGAPGLRVYPGSGPAGDILVTGLSGYPPSSGLAAGTATALGKSRTTASVVVGTATGGTGPYTYQWYRSTSSGFTPGGGNILTGATNLQLNDTGLTANTTYFYVNVVTDSASATANSSQLTVATTNNTEFAPNNASVVWSPYNWLTTSTASKTNCWGAYVRFTVTGTTAVTLVFDNSFYGSASNRPQFRYSVDGGAWATATLGQSVYDKSLATGLSSGSSHLVVGYYFWQQDAGEDYWNTPVEAISINEIAVDNGGSLAATAKASKNVIVFGDSITRGFYSGSSGAFQPGDAWQGFASAVGQGLGAEWAQIGMAGQGWVRAGGNNVPNFPSAWNLQWSGQSRTFSPVPDYVIVAQGYNDSLQTAGTVQTAVQSWLTTARSTFTTSTIFVVLPFAPYAAGTDTVDVPTEITNGFNAYQTATPDSKLKLIQVPSLMTFGIPGMNTTSSATAQTIDGTHPTAQAHAMFGAAIVRLIQQQLGGAGMRSGSF